MSEENYETTPREMESMPPGIPYIIGNEAAERFSFYGMKAVLMVFMTQHIVNAAGADAFMNEEVATAWIHRFVSAVYFFPIIGAIVSDWLFGKYNTILWLSIVYCIGHAVLALMDIGLPIDQKTFLFWGLALIAIGAGGIKPCVSAHVGDQFGKRNSFLLPIVFAWFYFSINFGSTISTLLTPYLRDELGPAYAFGVPGVLMAIATFAFWLGRHDFVHVPASGNAFWKETFSGEGIRAMFNLIPLYIFVAMFWALFDQTASKWVAQAEHMDRHLFGFEFAPDQLQAANPILVMILIPIFSYLIYPSINSVFKLSPLRKIGIGLIITIPAFIVPAWIESQIIAGKEPHIIWQILAYLILTAAEIMVSITCLEFSYSQSPKKMKSFIMGLFLLSVAFGNLFTAEVNHFMDTREKAGTPFLEGPSYYYFFAGCMAVTAIGFVIWSQFYKGVTYIGESDGQGDETSQDVEPKFDVKTHADEANPYSTPTESNDADVDTTEND